MTTFSVIISLHRTDTPAWFSEAWKSIVKQSCPPSKIYVTIDGKLTPELERELESLDSNSAGIPVAHVAHPGANSRGILLGEAVENCSTELIAIMDADDISGFTRFEKQTDLFSMSEDLDVVGSNVQEFCPSQKHYSLFKSVPSSSQQIAKFAKYRNPINNMSVMFRRSAVLAAGNYQHMPHFADYWLWVRMLARGSRFENIAEPLLQVRAGESMLNRRRGLKYAKHELHFYKKCYEIGFLSAPRAITTALLRAPVRLMPKFVLRYIFKSYLRSSDSNKS